MVYNYIFVFEIQFAILVIVVAVQLVAVVDDVIYYYCYY